jgi:hypothetical protein
VLDERRGTATGVCNGPVVHTIVAAPGLGALIRSAQWRCCGQGLAQVLLARARVTIKR